MKNEQQSQNLLFKVDLRSTFRNNFLQPQQMFSLRDRLITLGKKRETSTKTCNETMLRDRLSVLFVSRISPPLHTFYPQQRQAWYRNSKCWLFYPTFRFFASNPFLFCTYIHTYTLFIHGKNISYKIII